MIDVEGNRLRYVADGAVSTDRTRSLPDRLVQLFEGVAAVIARFTPDEAAVEETFVNKNPSSTLKLGQARGIVLLVPAQAGLVVGEYSPNLIKKTVVGGGLAGKAQVQMMVKTLLPGYTFSGADAADALAVAICHAHHRETARRVAVGSGAAGSRAAGSGAGNRGAARGAKRVGR
ncbi:Holliday junction endonuclease RuvC [Varunaivibrio sulfuroxidans]|uniref:Crossover junction endodeoxyribonuclease RuvC n=1 Tax=Varunaivibrio sulfuroxidans TaxID=1773489 RepID=A0A4R3JCN9_9PROT|nr:Holliday junction endonuclease RuvC [Varunaivibrio sulfuroxidans]